jgi:VanZ family protein
LINLNSPSSVRWLLAALTVASLVLLVYASLVPLDYTPLTWEETWDQWGRARWLNLHLYHRADWIANALVVLPSGMLATAAVGWGRKRIWPAVIAAPFVSLLLAGVVTGIEFVQIWFPTRTVSLNDVAAGYVGAILGPLIWIAAGHYIERGITAFLTLPHLEQRLSWLCLGYLAFITIYSVLPLDIVLTGAEWRARLAAVRESVNPFDETNYPQQIMKELILGGIRMMPIGVLLTLNCKPKFVGAALIFVPIAFELIQLPFYSKHVSLVEIFGGWLGGGVGHLLGVNLFRFQRIAARPYLWGVVWTISLIAVVTALLVPNAGVLKDPTDIEQRFAQAWAMPLKKYYVGTEYNAYTNMLLKAGLFAILGAISFGWKKTSALAVRGMVLSGTLLAVTVTAFGIELLQVFLPPRVPDISDGFIYLLGYAAGYQVARVLWGSGISRAQLSLAP